MTFGNLPPSHGRRCPGCGHVEGRPHAEGCPEARSAASDHDGFTPVFLFAHDYATHLPYCELLQVETSFKCTCGFTEALEAALTSEASSSRPRLLDLFCGAGGCSVGFVRSGFGVVGVDIKPQPNYPFDFIQGDALDVLARLLRGEGVTAQSGRTYYLSDFAAFHASPPCQAFTKARKLQGNTHEDLVGPTRDLLERTGLPWVIENVKGAPLRNPVMLEGQMFDGLNVHRPRLFETNWPLDVPVLRAPPPRQTKMGRPPVPGEAMQVVGHFSDVPAGREAMGIDWMTQGELAQAIPPAYTEFVGRQLLSQVRQEPAFSCVVDESAGLA